MDRSRHCLLSACIAKLAAALLAATLAACGGDSPEKLAASAKEFMAKGDWNSAIVQLKNVLQKSPQDGEARLLLGKAYLERRDYQLAEIELRRALELEQPADQVLPLLARVMIARGDSNKLLYEFAGARLQDRSAIAEFRSMLGDAYLRARRRDEARVQFEGALAAKSDNRDALLGLARLDAVLGKEVDAIRRVDELLSSAPNFVDALELKADLLLKQGDRAAAKKFYREVLARDPRRETANLTVAAVHIEDGEYEEAAKRLAAVRRGQTASLRTLFLESLLALRRGDTLQAREHVLQILGPVPEHVPTLALAGAIELEAGRFSVAEAYLQRALSYSPMNEGARRLLVGVYLKGGQPVRARDDLEELLARQTAPDPHLLLLAGETYLANGDLNRAAEYFRQATMGESVRAAARTKLGQLAFATGDYESGFKELQIAAEIDPTQTQADVAKVVAHLSRSELDKALEAALFLERKKPDAAQTHHLLGIVHLMRKDTAAGRKSLERSLELQPNFLPSAIALARLDLAEGKPGRAKERFERVIASDPRNDQAYVLLAETQARTKSSPEEVRDTLRRAVEANPKSARARLALISSHLHLKDRKAALGSIQEAIAAAPSDTVMLEGIAAAQERLGEKMQALETLRQLAAMQPQSPQPWQRLSAFHVRYREYERALEALRRARSVAPESRELVREYASVSVLAGKYAEAIREARDLQRREPRYAGGYAIEGEIHLAAKKFGEAEKAFAAALRVEPRGTALALRLHAVLMAAGKAAQAEALVGKWTKDNPKDVAFRIDVAQGALAIKNYPVAAAQYRAILEIEPNSPGVLNNLAWVLGEMKNPSAIKYAERAVALAPRSPAALDTLGVLLVEKGEVTKGLLYLDRAVKINGEAPQIRLHYARALVRAGHTAAARAQLEFLRDVPGDFAGRPEAESLLKQLSVAAQQQQGQRR